MGDYINFLLSREFWLPKNVQWPPKNLKNSPNSFDVLIYPFIIAIFLYFIRFTFERFVAVPIGSYFSIKHRRQISFSIKQSQILEEYFRRCVKPSELIIHQVSKELDLSHDDIKEWLNSKQESHANKPSKMDKFTESTWRFVFYLSIFLYGVWALVDKPWFWDTRHCWLGYPNHELEIEIFWYYMIELGFYLSLIVSQFSDVKRKDFWQMFTHHVVTIGLLLFSYIENYTRIGALILALHDAVDFWLELAKMAKYASLQRLCDSSFIIFATVWFVTRLILFPFRIIYSTTFEGTAIVGIYPAYTMFNICLYILQLMHIIWFYMICKVAYKAITIGKVHKDDRSESDASSNHEKQT